VYPPRVPRVAACADGAGASTEHQISIPQSVDNDVDS
jgi:hypothetical protein